jgi:hypothetical protein
VCRLAVKSGEPRHHEQCGCEELKLEAVLYGQIPRYGRTRLLYPILGEGLDISAETLVLGFATAWHPAVIFANIGFELATSTPLWFGGAYLFGWAFRPVTAVDVQVLSTQDGKQVWHESVERIVARTVLKQQPAEERSKKEVQLEASLAAAIDVLARVLSEGGHVEWWWPRWKDASLWQAPPSTVEAP